MSRHRLILRQATVWRDVVGPLVDRLRRDLSSCVAVRYNTMRRRLQRRWVANRRHPHLVVNVLITYCSKKLASLAYIPNK